MRLVLPLAVACIAGAQLLRGPAEAMRGGDQAHAPYAPSPAAAPFVAVGYRELAADVFWVELTGYFGGERPSADGIASLVEAITTLDPAFYRPYEWGARAMTLSPDGTSNAIFLRAIAVLEQGAQRFPRDWRLPNLAGQIYTQDLVTRDPAQRHAWDERGIRLVESAMRKPDAPPSSATWAAAMWSKLGQHQRAVDGLEEMLALTDDASARARIVAKLAELEHADAEAIASESSAARRAATEAWQAAHPMLPYTMYVLLGDPPSPRIDLGDLATGGRALAGERATENLPPLED